MFDGMTYIVANVIYKESKGQTPPRKAIFSKSGVPCHLLLGIFTSKQDSLFSHVILKAYEECSSRMNSNNLTAGVICGETSVHNSAL